MIGDYIERAERTSLNEIVFTTHLIVLGLNTSTSIRAEKIPVYLEDIWSVAADTDVKFKTSFEVDYIPEEERRIESPVDEYRIARA